MEKDLKTNPEYIFEKRNEYNRAYYALMSQDKAWRDERNKKQRAYSKQWRKQKANDKLQKKTEELKNKLIQLI
jgi:hypothetical protein